VASGYAMHGDFKEATRCQKRAIELGLGTEHELEFARAKLRDYEQCRP
jgi:hypothetical protein